VAINIALISKWAEAVRRQPVTAEAWVHSQASPCGYDSTSAASPTLGNIMKAYGGWGGGRRDTAPFIHDLRAGR